MSKRTINQAVFLLLSVTTFYAVAWSASVRGRLAQEFRTDDVLWGLLRLLVTLLVCGLSLFASTIWFSDASLPKTISNAFNDCCRTFRRFSGRYLIGYVAGLGAALLSWWLLQGTVSVESPRNLQTVCFVLFLSLANFAAPAIAEEAVLRGGVLQATLRWWPRLSAVYLAQAVCFVAIHFGTLHRSSESVWLLVAFYAISACMFTYIAIRTGSFWFGAGLHTAINFSLGLSVDWGHWGSLLRLVGPADLLFFRMLTLAICSIAVWAVIRTDLGGTAMEARRSSKR